MRPRLPVVLGHARRLFLWCCVFHVLMLPFWIADPGASAETFRTSALRMIVVTATMGPAFYLSWRVGIRPSLVGRR